MQLVKRGQSARSLQGSNLFTGIGGRYALACIHETNANIAGMRDALDSAILLDPGFPEPRRMRAGLRRREENFPGAVEDYSVFLRACPDDLDAREARGFSSLLSGDPQSALGDFSRILARWPGRVDAALGAADALDDLGRVWEAITVLRTAIALWAPGSDGRFQLQRMLLRLQVR